MLSIPLILTALLVLPGLTAARTKKNVIDETNPQQLFSIPMELWQCGSNMVNGMDSVQMAIHSIKENCPNHAAQMNHCCAVHDDCYSNQRNQTVCDDHFCECTKNVIYEDPTAQGCYLFAAISCYGVKEYGRPAYRASANLNYPFPPVPIEKRRVPNIERIGKEYADLYEKCIYQNVTMASCALNHDICRYGPDGEKKCIFKLMKCLENTQRDRKPSEQCDGAIDKVIKELMHPTQKKTENYAIENGTLYIIDQVLQKRAPSADSSVFTFSIVFAILFLVCIVALFATSRMNNRVAFDDLIPESESETTSEEKTKASSVESSKKN